jgi:proline iminopeptidase
VPRVVTSPPVAERRHPHPAIEPYAAGVLDVADGHAIAWELSGNPRGRPAVVLHGGPGGGRTPDHRRLFDPARYSVLLFDQRGCGGSRPHASLNANTTAHLVADVERLRQMVGVEQWLILGGSWGCALALAYAQTHPERVSALVLRGVFTGRRCEVAWLVGGGAARLFPDHWEHVVALVPDDRRGDVLGAYRALLASPHREVRLVAARRWCRWERAISLLSPVEPTGPDAVDEDAALALAEISVHYFAHGCFLRDGQLLADAGRLAGIPGILVQGRYDAVTPPRTAFDLHRAWPGSELVIVSDAGHASSEPGLSHYLLAATDRLAESTTR